MTMKLVTIRELYSASHIQAAEHLLALIAPHDTARDRLCQRLHHELSEQGDPDYYSELPIIWILAQISGFYVDWKDTESFKAFVEELAHEWGARDFCFPPDLSTDTDEPLTIPDLMRWAHGRLQAHGLLLWHWSTEEDNYCGAVSAARNWPEVLQACASLGVQAWPADTPFGDESDA